MDPATEKHPTTPNLRAREWSALLFFPRDGIVTPAGADRAAPVKTVGLAALLDAHRVMADRIDERERAGRPLDPATRAARAHLNVRIVELAVAVDARERRAGLAGAGQAEGVR